MKQHVSQPFLRDHAESCEGRHDKGQPTTACASGKEPKQRAGHFGSNARRFGSRALAATTSSVSLVQTGAPLSFSSWFACQARLLDIRLLALELIVVNWTNLPKVIFKTRCLPVAGSPHAAFQDAFPPPTHPSAARADARIFSFPCGAPYQQQLLHVVASGALTDPWVRVRAGDYGNLALVVSQLLAILVAVLLPRIYVRVRHWLLFAVNAVVLVAVAASVAWTPAALLPVGAASHLGPYWGSVMVLYLAWKSVYVLRVPASHQLLFGPVLWLMTMAVMPAVRASLYPPPPASTHDAPSNTLQDGPETTLLTDQLQHHMRFVSLLQQLLQGPALWIAVLSFFVTAVLPYAIARAWERAALRPRYTAYVTAVAEAAGPGGGNNRSGCRTQQADGGGEAEVRVGKDAVGSDSQPAGGAQRSRVASKSSGDSPPAARGAGPSAATPFAAAAEADAETASCSSGNSAHSAAGPLDGGTSALSVPTSSSLPSAWSVGDGGGTGRGSSSVAGAAAATADTAGTAHSPTKATYATSTPTYQDIEHQQHHDPERREQAGHQLADGGSGTSPHHPTTSTSLLHSLHPRRPWLDIGLLMSAAASHKPALVDSSRQRLSSSGSASGSGNINASSMVCGDSRSSPCSPLYGDLSPYRMKVLSVKVPLRNELGSGASEHSSFPAASARVVEAANAVIARHNAAAAAAAAVAAGASGATGALAGAVGQVPDAAASSLEGTLPRVVPLSCVCVEGCVHLLLLVREYAGGGYGVAELDADQLQQHVGVDNDGVDGAVVRHTTIGFGGSWNADGAEEEGGLEIEAAVLGMLNQGAGNSNADGDGGGGGLGSGGAAALAAVWPPAVAVDDRSIGGAPGHVTEAGYAAAPAGPEERRDAADSGVEVVVACGASLLRGLEALRCVVAGQGSGGGNGAATGEATAQGRVYADCVLPVASPAEEHGQQQGPVGATGAGGVAEERVARFRLQLPRAALLSPGVLTLHLLPPSPKAPAASPSGQHTPAPSGPHPAPYPHAPLCFLPLLVMPAAAAHEVAQLHAYAVAREMGWGEQGHGEQGEGGEQLQGTAEGNATYTSRVGHLLAGTRDATAAEAAAAIAALHRNGMYSLSYDFGALLDLPYPTARGSAPDPWIFCVVLRLLAEQGMRACLRMGLGAMQRAGVRLEAGGGGGAAGTEAGTARRDDDGEVTVDAAVQLLLDRAAAGRFQMGQPTQAEDAAEDKCRPGGAGCTRTCEEHEAGVAAAGGAGAPGARAVPRSYPQRLKQPPPEAAATAGNIKSASASTSFLFSCRCSTTPPSLPTPPPPGAPPPRGPNWRWWLRALLLGFQPTALEAAYQRYKTARCWSSDRLALFTHAGMAIMTLVRMLREGGGAGAGGAACQAHGAAGGARGAHLYDPQLAAHGLWLGLSLTSLLVVLTPLHGRHRNAALLLRCLSSATVHTAMLASALTVAAAPDTAAAAAWAGGTASAGRPWLVLPDAWVHSCQKHNVHWVIWSLWEPAIMRLSVRFQAALGAAYVPAAALLELLLHRYGQQQQQQQQQSALQSVAGGSGGAIPGQQGSGGSGGVAALGGWRTGCTGVGAAAASAAAWRAAAVFAVGNAVCGLVVSAVTDLAGRMASVKELRCRGTAAVVGQQQQLQDDASCRGGAVESSLSLKEKLKE